MAGNTPSGTWIAAGGRFLTALRDAHVPVYAAAWVFDDERDRWTLDIVSDWYKEPLLRPYEVIGQVFGDDTVSDDVEPFDTSDIVPVQRDSDLGSALVGMAPLARPTPRAVNDQFIAGVFIPKAVLYKVAA